MASKFSRGGFYAPSAPCVPSRKSYSAATQIGRQYAVPQAPAPPKRCTGISFLATTPIVLDVEFSIVIANWLKYNRFHKYNEFISLLTYQELYFLEENNIDLLMERVGLSVLSVGPRKKLKKLAESLRTRHIVLERCLRAVEGGESIVLDKCLQEMQNILMSPLLSLGGNPPIIPLLSRLFRSVYYQFNRHTKLTKHLLATKMVLLCDLFIENTYSFTYFQRSVALEVKKIVQRYAPTGDWFEDMNLEVTDNSEEKYIFSPKNGACGLNPYVLRNQLFLEVRRQWLKL